MRTAWLVFAWGILYGITESLFFGWNKHPTSGIELICSGISLLILAIAVLVQAVETAGKRIADQFAKGSQHAN
jgi:ABC-type uncharacterized transport system permease subunit